MEFERQTIVFQARRVNPVVQVLAGVLAVAGLVAMFFLGLVFFAVFAGVALVAGLLFWLRMKWATRKQPRPQHERGGVERMSPRDQSSDAIDGEFVVVDRNKQDGKQRR